MISAGIVNTAGAATILDAQLLFDGAVAADAPSSTAVSLASLNVSGSASTGSHTLGFLIASQTSTPNTYTVPTPDIEIYEVNGVLVNDLRLTTQQASLATGQSITYTFSF